MFASLIRAGVDVLRLNMAHASHQWVTDAMWFIREASAEVGRHVGVTTQAASEMCRRLAADGLVEPATGRGLALTDAGRAAADAIFRRHALLEWLLTSVVGLTWAESDVEAMRLQGALSPRVEAKLDELLGHPETCPHGNPIDLETSRRRPAGVPLSELE